MRDNNDELVQRAAELVKRYEDNAQLMVKLALVCSFSSLLLIYALKERNPSLFVACLIMEGIRLIPIVLVWFWFLVCAIAPSPRLFDVLNKMTGLNSTIESLRPFIIPNFMAWGICTALGCWFYYTFIFHGYKAALHGGGRISVPSVDINDDD